MLEQKIEVSFIPTDPHSKQQVGKAFLQLLIDIAVLLRQDGFQINQCPNLLGKIVLQKTPGRADITKGFFKKFIVGIVNKTHILPLLT
ncbi:hypothetical protein [Desulfitobacterium sp. LBE]|uniref:hypothetical protein n=1 Tax=Desulfitobacterium sp. LBE TaxID=884086 RepID=UPI00249DE2A7|nr:hypothetical protein [Desulfitobacterium sp. LBE]